jgi:hypothetical protein
MRPPRTLVALTLLAFALVPSAAHGAVGVGIADQKPQMFSDARFQALGIKYARVNVRWDVLKDPAATAALDTWMNGAKATGARPLVTFDRSPLRRSYDPKPAELVGALKGLRMRYGVTEFSTWNEANINKRPEIVAKWYRALVKACPSCTILGTDLVDHGNMAGWAKRFVKAVGRKPAVKVWGLHNYVDANRRSTKTTKALLKAVKGRIWFTETGGIVARNNASTVAFPTSAPHAAEVTKFIFDKLARLSPRIERVYLYHWDTGGGADSWDSAFVGPDDATRPALEVLKGVLTGIATGARK